MKSSTRLLSGAKMDPRSILLEHTLVLGGETVDSHSAWQGLVWLHTQQHTPTGLTHHFISSHLLHFSYLTCFSHIGWPSTGDQYSLVDHRDNMNAWLDECRRIKETKKLMHLQSRKRKQNFSRPERKSLFEDPDDSSDLSSFSSLRTNSEARL